MSKVEIKPKNWRKVKLGEFASINPSIQLQRGKEYSFLDMADVVPLSRTVNWPKRKIFNGSGAHFEEGDTLFARITPCLENGKITQALNLRQPGFGSTEFYVLRGKKDISNSDFVHYLSRSFRIRKLAEASMIGASGRQRVERAAFENIEINVPLDIAEQKRIASILSTFDDKIELNNKISKNLEQMAQAIFKEWFVKFKVKSEKLKVKNGIPEEWEMKDIGSIANVALGGTPSRLNSEYWGGGIPWINSGKVNEFRIISASEYITKKGLDNSNARLMPKRTTVIAITGATLGQVSLLEIEASANQSVVGIFDSDTLPSEFIYLYIKQQIDDLVNAAAGGAQQHINKQIVETYPILIPDKDTITEFKNVVRPIFDQIANVIFENQKLAALRDLLLPKLMSGEILVNS